LFLGPLGLFYTDSFGGFITFIVGLVSFLLSPIAGIIVTWVLCIIWAVIAAKKANILAKERSAYFTGKFVIL
jgi:type IV secretory pathway TrbL component